MSLRRQKRLKRLFSWATLVLLFLTPFCSHKPDPAPTWNFAPGGIRITYTADKFLNRVGDKSHTLVLTIHQMNDPNPFKRLAKYEEGLRKLLDGKSADPTITAVQKFFVEPGESKTLLLDRVENSKWIGVAAGYYDLDPDKVVKVFEIPFAVESKGFISKERVAKVPPFNVDLILGPESIQVQEKPTK